MKTKTMIIITVLLLVFAIGVVTFGAILGTQVKEEKIYQNQIQTIKDTYGTLSFNYGANTTIKTSLSDVITNFDTVKYEEKEEEYLKLLNSYNENIKLVDKDYNTLNEECIEKHEDATVNIICKTYQSLYEEMVNSYVTNVNNYNEKLTEYNQKNNTNHELFTMLYTEHIDADKDGKFKGKGKKTK